MFLLSKQKYISIFHFSKIVKLFPYFKYLSQLGQVNLKNYLQLFLHFFKLAHLFHNMNFYNNFYHLNLKYNLIKLNRILTKTEFFLKYQIYCNNTHNLQVYYRFLLKIFVKEHLMILDNLLAIANYIINCYLLINQKNYSNDEYNFCSTIIRFISKNSNMLRVNQYHINNKSLKHFR